MTQNFDIYQLAKQFKAEATQLIERLCASAQVSVKDSDRNTILFKHFGKQIEHDLDDTWTFTLHGAECRFIDKRTNRQLEVILIHGDNFGAVDFHYFSEYLTQERATVGNDAYGTKNPTEIENQVRQLYNQGLLIKINTSLHELNRNVSA